MSEKEFTDGWRKSIEELWQEMRILSKEVEGNKGKLDVLASLVQVIDKRGTEGTGRELFEINKQLNDLRNKFTGLNTFTKIATPAIAVTTFVMGILVTLAFHV